MKEHRNFIAWIKAHKKQLVIAGFSIAGLIAIILGIKNRAALKVYWANLMKAIERPDTIAKASVSHAPSKQIVHKAIEHAEPAVHTAIEHAKPVVQLVTPAVEAAPAITRTTSMIPFEVDQHIRNLPLGKHASPEKIATAVEHGFELLEGQTWVEAYMKGGAVA